MHSTIASIVSQHAEMLAHLWLIRDRAVHAPHYSLKDLQRLDGRIAAHWDGLRVAGEEGLRLCLEQLNRVDPGTFFAAAVVALEQQPDLFFELSSWVAVDKSLARPLIAALQWQGAAPQRVLAELLEQSDEAARYIGVAAAASARLPAPWLEARLRDASPMVRGRALRAVGEYGRVDLWRTIYGALEDAQPECRYFAAWSACLLGQQAGVEVLRDTALKHDLRTEQAIEAATLGLGTDAALAWQRALHEKGHTRLALICARTAPSPGAVPFLLQQMEAPEHARLAGEAFTFLTGLDLALRNLEANAPDGFQAGPNDDPTDERVALDPDEDLPWPDVAKLQQEWHKLRPRFEDAQRYLLGQRLEPEALQETLRTGKQRQRRVAALALARLRPPLFETRALAHHQQLALGISTRPDLQSAQPMPA